MTESETHTAAALAPGPNLASRVPEGGTSDPDEILSRFIDWAAEAGYELYPAQEEALLELMAGKHVILNTPTGSGKSLVALGLHFKALCEGQISYYTSPIKALASEKFFSLCNDFGPENVGMLTGDASINPTARVICCTAEVLSNMALRQGETLDAPYVVMDEFHYYSDAERGIAWQVPLLVLPYTRFLLMSATLGDVSAIAEHLKKRTGGEVAHVISEHRPVPLDYEYRETPLHETIEELLNTGRSPIYIVNFTQRDCAELAQSLTSMKISSREEREKIRDLIAGARLDTPYGKEFRRFLSFGIGVHHAGLLPKYRLLVEQLAQQGLLRVISGTDTLGVGVNIPIRTVLFTKLAKFDGKKVATLSVRDFKQIAGRAGRKGFDTRGSVVAQAPEHIIEQRMRERKASAGGKKSKAPLRGPAKGEVSWSEETFERLIQKPPETLRSRFRITHGMVLNLLQRDAEINDPNRPNFASLRELIERSHEDESSKAKWLQFSAIIVRSLYRADVLRVSKDTKRDYFWVVISEDLQWDFSLHHVLSLFLIETLGQLDPESETYAADLITLVEAVLENPEAVLRRQVDKLKTVLITQLKAQGVDYDERMERLEEVTHPQPMADFLRHHFLRFRRDHPWVGNRDIAPKSIGREMLEGFFGFSDYVRQYGLQRSEGVLLRYISQLYKTLEQSVPELAKSPEVYDGIGFFRALLQHTDTSLIEEWESRLHPELLLEKPAEREEDRRELRVKELLGNPMAFGARVRAELHLLLRALANRDWEEAAASTLPAADDPEGPWTPERFEAALAPFFAEYGELSFTADARRHQWTTIKKTGNRTWEVAQTLLDPEGDNLWAARGTIDLTDPSVLEGPLVHLERIGP